MKNLTEAMWALRTPRTKIPALPAALQTPMPPPTAASRGGGAERWGGRKGRRSGMPGGQRRGGKDERQDGC